MSEGMWMTCKLPFYMGNKVDGSSVAYPTGYENDWVRWGHAYTDAFDDIRDDVQLSPSNADLAMISNYLGLNVQFSPVYGKFSLFNWGLAHADFYVTVGGGIATTELKTSDNLWVDAGIDNWAQPLTPGRPNSSCAATTAGYFKPTVVSS